ncbi:hypothetical protein F383_02965 [Gossypium arboreum]|uniref:Uncharacterized protein n=1 Tax=Gossypium arboreum TaxID=29729 RepID=A0A0B0PDR2_GOSAR|nr:hypothetical protein F383_02965 [Gossypium arboreum]
MFCYLYAFEMLSFISMY